MTHDPNWDFVEYDDPREMGRTILRRLRALRDILIEQGKHNMATVADIKALLTKDEGDLADLVGALNTTQATVASQQATIASLQQQLSNGGTVTSDDLQAISDGLTTIDNTITSAIPAAPSTTGTTTAPAAS